MQRTLGSRLRYDVTTNLYGLVGAVVRNVRGKKITEYLPRWKGYGAEDYVVSPQAKLWKSSIAQTNSRRISTCYVYPGYCIWLDDKRWESREIHFYLSRGMEIQASNQDGLKSRSNPDLRRESAASSQICNQKSRVKIRIFLHPNRVLRSLNPY